VVLTDSTAIRELNRDYLDHNCPTDVISFCIELTETRLEAEVVVSAQVAKKRCKEFGLDEESELFLYVIHGVLHQVGYDDQTEADAKTMRRMEAKYLRML
jgi:probable rRNA maturation factor